MALVSPGVEVTIIDQSQYLPAASNSVPLILLATAENKANAAGTGVAAATTAANANKLYQVTSQRDLVNLFGTPFFYKTTNGTPIQGYELNEYGLLATYSLLGATNRAYVLRADIDLGQLVGTLSRPTGNPADGTYWLDTTNSTWGIYEFNADTGKFTQKTPTVIVDSEYIEDNYPVQSIGNIGSYAVIPTENLVGDFARATYFYKNFNNEWVVLGSSDWKKAVPFVIGSNGNPTLNDGDYFSITVGSSFYLTVPIVTGDTTETLANKINALGVSYLFARTIDGRLAISYGEPGLNKNITLSNVSGTPLQDLGLATTSPSTFYCPDTSYGTSANMPLWTAGQSYPHPTGSVWIKTSIAGSGMDLNVSRYITSTDTWKSLVVGKYTSVAAAIGDLSSDGGKSIPAGTVIATYQQGTYATQFDPIPYEFLTLWEKTSTGSVTTTGTVTSPSITSGLDLTIVVSNSDGSVSTYVLTTTGTTATAFVSAWLSANIADTTASVSVNNAVQITHNNGGIILLSDIDTTGQSNGLLSELGFSQGGANVSYGSLAVYKNSAVSPKSVNSLAGSGGTYSITNFGTYYEIEVINGGSGYILGDTITFSGADIGGVDNTNDVTIRVMNDESLVPSPVASFTYVSGTPKQNYFVWLGNWSKLEYIANEGAPVTNPLNGTKWFYSTASQVDIMINKDGEWYGYGNVNYDQNGHPIDGSNTTDPNGPIVSTTAPTEQSSGDPLQYGDLWLDTSDLENYPKLSRWQMVDSLDQWVAIDNTDQTSQNGILFADARWANNGTVNPVNDPIVPISTLLTTNYIDLDAPDPTLFPQGMLLFNTRRSGYNVKQFTTNYFTAAKYPDMDLPTNSYTWVSASGLQSNGAAYMGRKAQRNMVVQALKAAIGTNQSILEEDTFFNLISCPNYPELQPDMVTLNNNRNNTAYIIGDTPLRLPDQATDLINWATNQAGAISTGEDGLVTRNEYMGLFYPSGITTDLTGAAVVVPASHMMLRTFLRNDTIAYPWLAPAGTRRGTIDNATNIGYLDAATGEFVVIKNRMAIRDVLYTNQINPLAYFTGIGLLNYGNKNVKDTQSALDRINVARLVAYIRYQLQILARPFVFEPNDALTRSQIQGVVQSLFIDLVAKRGLYDYLVVCDDSNNTPARIDRNELWIDVAIEPVKAAEFIYIPVRVLNTGEIASLK
jgi:hypothetical protein